MKLLGVLLISAFSTFAMALTPAKVTKITTDNGVPVATYKVTVLMPCEPVFAGQVNESQGELSQDIVLGVLKKRLAPDEMSACEAEETEKEFSFKVYTDHPINNLIVLGNYSGIEVTVEKSVEKVDSNKAIYDALSVKAEVLPPQIGIPEVSVTRLQKQAGGLICIKTITSTEDIFGGFGSVKTEYECYLTKPSNSFKIFNSLDIEYEYIQGDGRYAVTKKAGHLFCSLEAKDDDNVNDSKVMCSLK